MPLWQQAGVAAGALLVLAVLLRIALRWRPSRVLGIVAAASQETGIILALFTFWQIARILGVTRVAGGLERADWIWHAEQWAHLPSEVSMEMFMLDHERWLRAANVFYSWVHFPAMNLFLVWLFTRHRDAYPSVRMTIVLFTGSSLLFHMFLPVAPPRMLTSAGFVDEAVVLGQSVYGEFGSGVAAQLSALPSVHVGWAFLIAYEVIRISPSRWRWLIVLHPVLTTLVVVVTANHFWADGIVAVVLLILAEIAGRALRNALRDLRERLSGRRRREPAPDLATPGAPPSWTAPASGSATMVADPGPLGPDTERAPLSGPRSAAVPPARDSGPGRVSHGSDHGGAAAGVEDPGTPRSRATPR
ncbi:phosphatase PAP2 family protein [Frankia sp. AgKG'84/4]|uniref:phosphatase PAP2 family protein n=1 Tax=Frankia sp. AgKG'84/4 TaxID=573490 RepID=UPI002029C3DB|nr:phosphatase PAP2 family protein [Frankia sp. AgKG'84/4]MCL9795467.1 phosphatase PAP2 family protein [Frankia sp. AgKG'84/4]